MVAVSDFLSPAARFPPDARELLKFGAKPSLFVYGDSGTDVRIARLICKAEGCPGSHRQSLAPPLDPEGLIGETEKIFSPSTAGKSRLPFSISGLTGRTG